MSKLTKLAVITALALAAFGTVAPQAIAASGAQALPGGAIRQTSLGLVTFQAGSTVIQCNLTLTGNLERNLIRFAEGVLHRIGQITRVDWRECRGGEVERVLGLPWDIAVNQLLEEPRNCRGVTLIAANFERVCGVRLDLLLIGFQLSIFGGFFRCLYGSSGESLELALALAPLTLRARNEREAEYSIGQLTILAELPFTGRTGGCPTPGTFAGRFNPPSPTQIILILR